MGFDRLKDLARAGYLPSKITKAEKVVCAACQIGKAHLKSADKSPIVSKDKIKEPGDLIHMDQAESSTPGRPLTYSGKNNKNKIFIVTLFVDSISKKIFAEFQRSTGAEESLDSKHSMEREAKTSGISIKAFRSNNGVFKAAEFRADLDNLDQHITYCGVGAHHQNGIAERYIRTMVQKSRTVLLNAHARWPKPMKM